MEIGQLFWLFFILTAVQPIVRQRMMESARQRLIARIENRRKSRVILMVHRQETMSLLGFPVMRYIDIQDAEEVLRACELTDESVPLDIILHTPGGLVLPSLQIARAVRRHKGRVTVFVPHYAMSGGTLIALAADEIVLSPHAVLGPVDPQLNGMAAASILKVVERKPLAEVDDQTLILADNAAKAIQQLKTAAADLLSRTMPADRAAAVASVLASGERWTHDYPITADAAREMGLNVSTQMPRDVMQLLSLYPQPKRSAPTVEYLPERRAIRRAER
jgi:ClpP class serine protease